MDNVVEIDGPKTAFFEYEESGTLNRVMYVSLIVGGTIPDRVVSGLYARINEITDELRAVGGGVLYWRERPRLYTELNEDGEPNGEYVARCRLGTTPRVWEALSDYNDRLKGKMTWTSVAS